MSTSLLSGGNDSPQGCLMPEPVFASLPEAAGCGLVAGLGSHVIS